MGADLPKNCIGNPSYVERRTFLHGYLENLCYLFLQCKRKEIFIYKLLHVSRMEENICKCFPVFHKSSSTLELCHCKISASFRAAGA